MKKLFLLLALIGIFATACEEDGIKEPTNDNPIEKPDDGGEEQEDPIFEVDQDGNYFVTSDGGEIEVTVTTNLEYTVDIPTDAQSWITIVDTRATRQENIVLSVAMNDTYDERSAQIGFLSSEGEVLQSFTITQEPTPVFEVDQDGNYIVTSDGGEIEVTVTTNLEYTIDIPTDAQSWITIVDTRATRQENIVLSVAMNDTYDERSAQIGFLSSEGEVLQSFTITQEPTPAISCANNEIWYTNGSTTEPAVPNDNAFGDATIVSNEYDAEKECWVITFNKDIVEIGDFAFYACNITSVTIPDSVYIYGACPFAGCVSLNEFKCKIAADDGRCLILGKTIIAYAPASGTEYTIPDNVTTIGFGAFAFCYSLERVNIPNSVTTIENSVFFQCESLTSVTIPDSVTAIGVQVFAYCDSLESINIPDSVTTIGDNSFDHCVSLTSVTIPDSVTTIGDYAFGYCMSLESINIPDSVTSIGKGVFYHCESLTSVTIPDSVTTIGDWPFAYCYGLESIDIPDSVTSIGKQAFYECTSLTSVTIPDSVTTIENGTFFGCYRLTSITIPDSVTTIGEEAFFYCMSLESIDIPDSVTTIEDWTFGYCTSLESIDIPDSVTTIGYATFAYCESLTSVTIPDSVTTIGGGVFYDCESLTSVTIPDSVTSIGEEAFACCYELTKVYCESTTPPAGGKDMFLENAPDRMIYVPTESVDAYKTAGYWSDYADAIVGYEF